MNQYQPKIANELVLNWHITEACNYSCKYCFAHWGKIKNNNDIIHNESRTVKLLVALNNFFKPDNRTNPLQEHIRWPSLRLNIVGGEPLLYDNKVIEVIRFAREIGMNVSLITNGSRLSKSLMRAIAPHLSFLGVSLDSVETDVNRSIGRLNSKGEFLEIFEVCNIFDEGRLISPSMKIKVNTVVNSENYNEDMTNIIHSFNPDRWKVFKMLPILNNNLTISNSNFEKFISRHDSLKDVMSVENNSGMTESYIMIDPQGRFFQNSINLENKGYCYSPSILDNGIETAFSSMNFSPDKFLSRYPQGSSEVTA